MKENDGTFEMPMSMVMAMAESSAAMSAFCALPEKRRAEIIEKARSARCPAEMKAIIAGFSGNGTSPDFTVRGVRGLR